MQQKVLYYPTYLYFFLLSTNTCKIQKSLKVSGNKKAIELPTIVPTYLQELLCCRYVVLWPRYFNFKQSCNIVDISREIIFMIDPSSSAYNSIYTMRYSKTQPPDFPPKGSGHVISNFLLSAGILAQYKTFRVSFKQYL